MIAGPLTRSPDGASATSGGGQSAEGFPDFTALNPGYACLPASRLLHWLQLEQRLSNWRMSSRVRSTGARMFIAPVVP